MLLIILSSVRYPGDKVLLYVGDAKQMVTALREESLILTFCSYLNYVLKIIQVFSSGSRGLKTNIPAQISKMRCSASWCCLYLWISLLKYLESGILSW